MSSLNLRYYNLENPTKCISILSMEPQYRTIFISKSDPHGVRRQYDIVRLPFPHLVFVFKYRRVPGGFLYGGLQEKSLSIAFTNNPLDSFENTVYASPLEHHGFISCTDHAWDCYIFKNPRVLMGTILELWWGSTYFARESKAAMWQAAWQNHGIEGALTIDWPALGYYDDRPEKYTSQLEQIVPISTKRVLRQKSLINKPLKRLPSLLNKINPEINPHVVPPQPDHIF
jgi:hypothetical protein